MPVTITSTSSLGRGYYDNRATDIYPPFVNGIKYESWGLPQLSIAASRKEFHQLTATGGNGSFLWSHIGGNMPEGLMLQEDGKIYGTPVRPGDYTFTLKATSGAESGTKTFNLTSNWRRNKWFDEARAIAWQSIGSYQWPRLYQTNEMAQVDARLSNWNIDAWVQKLFLKGYDAVNYGGRAGDSVKHYPSLLVTPRNLKTSRNYINEIGVACHSRDMNQILYIAPDMIMNDPYWQPDSPAALLPDGTSSYSVNEANYFDPVPMQYYQSTNPANTTTYSTNPEYFRDPDTMLNGKKLLTNPRKIPTKSGIYSDPPSKSQWGPSNIQFCQEIITWARTNGRPPVDAFWMDVGAANPALYPQGTIDVNFWLWETIWPIIRYYDPWLSVGINGGVSADRLAFGNMWQFPHIDKVFYEGQGGNLLRSTMAVGCDIVTPKRISSDTVNIFDVTFAFDPTLGSPGDGKARSIETIIENHRFSKENKSTPSWNWPAGVDGDYSELDGPEYANLVSKLSAEILKEPKAISDEPIVIISEQGLVTITTQTPGLRIFYTLDGQSPTTKSMVYKGPFTVNSSVWVKAISIQAGRRNSLEGRAMYHKNTNEGSRKLMRSVTGDVSVGESNGNYRGMEFTVQSKDIRLYSVGRRTNTLTIQHNLIIREFQSSRIIYWDIFDNSSVVEEDGYAYSSIAPLVLKAGMKYTIAIQEGAADQYFSNNFSAIPSTRDIRIDGNRIYNSNGDIAPVTQNGIGQFLNFKYDVIEPPEGARLDLAKGKRVWLQHHTTGAILPVNAAINYATNATDGTDQTGAQAAVDWQWMLVVDFDRLEKYNTVIVTFAFDQWATEYDIYVGDDNLAMKPIATKKNNDLKKLIYQFPTRESKYIAGKVTLPNGPNQKGNGVLLLGFEVYNL